MTNENLCEWRERLYGEYRRGLDAISQIADKNRSAYWAAAQVNDILKLDKIFIHDIPLLGGVNLPAPVLARLRMGECDDYAFKCAYVMRACGIPVSVDFTTNELTGSALNQKLWNYLKADNLINSQLTALFQEYVQLRSANTDEAKQRISAIEQEFDGIEQQQQDFCLAMMTTA